MNFWQTEEWHAYEQAGDNPIGTRLRLLQQAPWQTQMLDLTQEEKAIWRAIRKSYKSLIHKGERTHTIMTWADGTSHNELWMREFHLLHTEVSGRETRPQATWDIMLEWLNTGHGMLLGAYTEEPLNWVGFVYFVLHDDWAYYTSAASRYENINHALVWTAMKALKCRGVARLELGWQGYAKDPKGQNIEFFRRGFGGVLVPVVETL